MSQVIHPTGAPPLLDLKPGRSQRALLGLGRHGITRGDLWGALIAAVGSLLAATFSLQLWHMHLGIPLQYTPGNDDLFQLAVVKMATSGTGWIYTNSQLGAPFGLNLADFPLATDNLNYFGMWVISWFTGGIGTVENLWFLSTFPLLAVSGYAVMRWMNVSVASAAVVAVLFADAPYHLVFSEGELLLSDYVTVPIATYLILSILDGRRVVSYRAGSGRWRALCAWRNLWTLVLVMVIASTGVYYAGFTIILLVAAGIVGAVRNKNWIPFRQTVALVLAIVAVIAVNDSPAIIYRIEHGANPAVAVRPASESEEFALKLAAMALPVAGDRIAPLAALRQTYDSTNPLSSAGDAPELGTIATVGLAWMLLLAVAGVMGVGPVGRLARRQRQLAFLTLSALLVGTVGGVSSLIAYLVFTGLRLWSLIAIFIAFFALSAVAIGLDAAGRRWFAARRAWAGAGLLAVCLFGVFDQSSRNVVPPYASTMKSWDSDTRFVDKMQRVMPSGGAVFQLPFMSFPEGFPVNGMGNYDELAGWLHSTDLRWSFAAMAGRPADWASETVPLPTQTLVDAVASAGFDGIWIERRGYPFYSPPVIPELETLLAEQPLNSPDGRFAFFDLRRYDVTLRKQTAPAAYASLRQAVLHPIISSMGTGFWGASNEVSTDASSSLAFPDVTMSVRNNSSRPRRAVFWSEVHTEAQGRFMLTVTLPSHKLRRFLIGPTTRVVRFIYVVPPGASTLVLDSNAPNTPEPGETIEPALWFSTPVIAGVGMRTFLPRVPTTALQ